ncbi:hypothetical protein SAMN02745945_01961 [Peptoclostridium litorale DSM 5388]|uniref:ACT domain-containing protein n=1 Tax=Peptoclostridium litorale DSM 5388 TaxID=1121324 RepID=A0A069RGU7_PEPLI|nr:hypothetical protein [Peptoclostridium litorale]KDR96231.1 hypothetical protein CLIT_4c00680 [Peptoclostridium litorale DSM 5388]SIO14093.1 hypothetical protein SAMN02745945_01961 [Peptoclostridium litorale DSM 5388]
MKLLKIIKDGDDKLKRFIDTLKRYNMTIETRDVDAEKAYIRVYEYDLNRIHQVARKNRVQILEA